MTRAERPRLHRWTRGQYARLIDHRFLDEDDPIELLDGLLLVKEPQSSPHRTGVLLVAKALEHAFGEGWFVQTQSPIILDDRSEPEPDVCVVRGSPRDYVDAHPVRPALIVEVAHSGLALARGRKAAAYARAGIADYWIVYLVDRVLEVHREPMRTGPARRHWGYASTERLGADAPVAPLTAPSSSVRVANLLPYVRRSRVYRRIAPTRCRATAITAYPEAALGPDGFCRTPELEFEIGSTRRPERGDKPGTCGTAVGGV